MPSACIFEFDRPDPVYFSGETINGRILLQTTKKKSVRAVAIIFVGLAKVHWTEEETTRRDDKDTSETVHYRAHETYFNSRTEVFGDGNLPPGTHTYTFCIPLPLECPTSCSEKYGKIHYTVSLRLERSFRFDNVFTQPLTVLRQLNLNLHPEYLIPLMQEDWKYFCSWPCSSGPVISTLTIPFGGYAPGQKIKYTLEVDNQSHGYDLLGIQLELVRRNTFTAKTPRHKTRTISNTLQRSDLPERFLRLSKRRVEGSLRIPSVSPTTEGSCIIQARYYIKMTISTGTCHSDSEIQFPIVIGTIPLAQSATNLVQATAPEAPDNLTDNPPSYDACKPPTFEEATTISEKFVDTEDNEFNRHSDWVPKYPMYTNFAVPSAPPTEAEMGSDSRPLLQEHRSEITSCPYPVADTMPRYPTSVNDHSTLSH